MIPNVKKVMFLALVSVLQWNSHPQFLVYVLLSISNIKHFWSSRMAPKQVIANLCSTKLYQVGLVAFYMDVSWDDHLPKTTTGPKSGHFIQLWSRVVILYSLYSFQSCTIEKVFRSWGKVCACKQFYLLKF